MPIHFDTLTIGHKYDRPHLADVWGYRGHQALARGVVTPRDQKTIVLFVTRDMQGAKDHYENFISGDRLHWEGENSHANDLRVVNAADHGDQIHLFFRERSHSDFEYFGQIHLESFQLLRDTPSRFVFRIGAIPTAPDLIDDIQAHQRDLDPLTPTEKEAVVKSRIGQGKFRDELIKLWGGCSVTGITNLSLLRASHIKPWRDSSNAERLGPMNGLLLHPTLDHLFDSGYISFDDAGQILISEKLSQEDAKKLGVDAGLMLRMMPEGIKVQLAHHREFVFRG